MTTVLDLIKLALKTAGVLAAGQTPQAEDVNDALLLLNSMTASWSQNRWLAYHLVDIAAPATGAISYTVGPTGDFKVTRPDRLQSAYVRLLTPATSMMNAGLLDYPLSLIETYEEYGELSLKRMSSFPTAAFYDATLGLGTLYIWPLPSTRFEIHIVVKETLGQFANLTAPLNLPPEYFEALLYNLTGRLYLSYRLPVNPAVIALAAAALNTIRVANHRVGTLKMPVGLSRSAGWATHGVGGVVEGTFSFEEDTVG